MEKTDKIIEKFHLSEVIAIAAMFFIGCGYMVSEMHRIEGKIDQQASRTDHLYEMFIDLLKEGRK